MYMLDPEKVGYQFLNSRRILPKHKKIYLTVTEEYYGVNESYPELRQNCRIHKDETGIFFWPSVAFAKVMGIDKTSMLYRYKKSIFDAKSVLEGRTDYPIVPGTRCIFFSAEELQAVQLFSQLRNEIAKKPNVHRIAKMIIA